MNETQLFDAITRIYRPYVKNIQPILAQHDLHAAQWLVLKDIAAYEPTTLVKIAYRRSIEKPTSRRFVKTLLELELITVTIGKDKRERLLSLSEKGKNVYNDIYPQIKEKQRQYLEEINISEKDYDMLIHTLTEIYNNLLKE